MLCLTKVGLKQAKFPINRMLLLVTSGQEAKRALIVATRICDRLQSYDVSRHWNHYLQRDRFLGHRHNLDDRQHSAAADLDTFSAYANEFVVPL